MRKMGAEIICREEKRVRFRVLAYHKEQVSVVVKIGKDELQYPMKRESPHVFSTEITVPDFNLLYKFCLDKEGVFPDPYSHYQPEGVHGYSQLVDHQAYQWQDRDWQGRDLSELIIMEIHIGTFTQEGTFHKAAEKIPYLTELGVTAVEIMPVTQTPGRWNWGYDGINLFSVNHNYGTPDDFKNFIDKCHRHDLAVILDVVYNHFGPEGNCLPFYGPYFTDKHQTPWGPAVNYDDGRCEFTREMVLCNVRFWLDTYHLDGLRLDAVHAIRDDSTPHILQEIAAEVQSLGRKLRRKVYVIAESDENNVRLITPLKEGGYGMDAQWMDDFHHVLHTALTGENEGYYVDYGRFSGFRKVYKNYLYTGEYSRYWGKKRGTNGLSRPGRQFVVAIQNHDQVGNRAKGERLSALVDYPYLKAAAGLLFFSPYIPLLFMGEEYGEKQPFLFFTDYQDPRLKKAVSQGRREEFRHFGWAEIPDPQDPAAFFSSKLTPLEDWQEKNRQLFNFYQDLISLRLTHPVIRVPEKNNLEIFTGADKTLILKRWNKDLLLTALCNLGKDNTVMTRPAGKELLNSEWPIYGGNKENTAGILAAGQIVIYETKL